MMPVIRINDATFAELSTLSKWLGTKTPGETIDRIVQDALEGLGMERDSEPEEAATITGDGVMEFYTAPGLTFTKPLSALVNGQAITNPRWSAILLHVIAQVKAKGFEGKRLVKELNVPAKAERYEEEGFSYHPDLGISVQGQSAADAWKEIDRLAKAQNIPVSVEFWWRQNAKAQYPGKVGRPSIGQRLIFNGAPYRSRRPFMTSSKGGIPARSRASCLIRAASFLRSMRSLLISARTNGWPSE